jgi:chemotaxis signal transduction protein
MKSSHTGSGASNGTTHDTARGAGTGTASFGQGGSDTELKWFDHSVCAFWLGDHCYGLVASLVGEVFLAEACTPVPVAPPAVIGLFNLRGTPVALVDMAQILELPGGTTLVDERPDGMLMALVLRADSLLVGALIRKMEVVIPAGQSLLHPADQGPGEHPAVAGFLELPERPELTVTLLDPQELVSRLDRLRYRDFDDTAPEEV